MNKAFLTGNLTKDPELRQTQNGVNCCTFTIACNRTYKNADGKHDADFLNIVTWRGLADTCSQYLRKGRKVAITGMIQTRSYEDKDGKRRTVTEIVADDVEFLTRDNNDSRDQFADEWGTL